jgi:hypothetical protein
MVKLLLPISKIKGKTIWFKNYPHMKTTVAQTTFLK